MTETDSLQIFSTQTSLDLTLLVVYLLYSVGCQNLFGISVYKLKILRQQIQKQNARYKVRTDHA